MSLRTIAPRLYPRATQRWELRVALCLFAMLLPFRDASSRSPAAQNKADQFELPDTLTRLDLPDVINHVDLIGRGSAKDLIIRAMAEGGTVYAPLVTQVLVHDDWTSNTGWAEYAIVRMPKIFDHSDKTLDNTSMNCFQVSSDFLQFFRNGKTETIMIRAIKGDPPWIGGQMSIFVYRLIDDGSEADNMNYRFVEVRHEEIYSDACEADELDPVIQNVLGVHIRDQ